MDLETVKTTQMGEVYAVLQAVGALNQDGMFELHLFNVWVN